MHKLICLGLFAMCSAVDYFPKGYFNSTDVTTTTWAHAVNTKSLLANALADSSIKMLEADLSIGTVEGGDPTETSEVIMAHPPANHSDLSFEMFLNHTIEHNRNLQLKERKGIKLDFKNPKAALLAIPDIDQKRKENPDLMNFPIWINADILPGPVNASNNSVTGEELITLQKTHSPQSTLSLGWTTRFGRQSDGAIIRNGSYTRQNIDEIVALIRKEFPDAATTSYPVEITFPLRAGLALNSLENIKYLLFRSGINFTSPSITLWEGSDDPPLDKQELNEFIRELSPGRVFVDLPYSSSRNHNATKAGVNGLCYNIGILLITFIFNYI